LLIRSQSYFPSVSLGVEPTLGLATSHYFLSEGFCLVSMGRPLCREDASAICSAITQVSHPYRTTGKIKVLYILILKFFDSNREDRSFQFFFSFISSLSLSMPVTWPLLFSSSRSQWRGPRRTELKAKLSQTADLDKGTTVAYRTGMQHVRSAKPGSANLAFEFGPSLRAFCNIPPTQVCWRRGVRNSATSNGDLPQKTAVLLLGACLRVR
jgi:hypothetical protein